MTTEGPPNPLEGPEPLDPLDDPMLDAVERSIVNPPGFQDPLAENDELHMDDLGRILHRIEADTEGTLPVEPPIAGNDVGIPDTEEGDLGDLESLMPIEENEPPETAADWPASPSEGLAPPFPQDASHKPSKYGLREPPASRARGGGSGRRGRSLRPRQRGLGRSGRIMGTSRRGTRYCPDTREIVGPEQCENCDKYRHWPEGTDEEPKECWYDWQARPAADEPDDH